MTMRRLISLWFVLALGASPAVLSGTASAETLAVPSNLIALDSAQGRQLLISADISAAYFPLSEQFTTQINQAFCGVASTVMVLNALHMPAPRSAELGELSVFDQQNVFDDKTEVAVSRDTIEHMGMTLDQLGGFVRAHGLNVEVHHAADGNVDGFRRDAIARLGAPDQYVLINFLRSALNEKVGGHISPLAAYNAKADRFLVLDVSRYKYPPVWVTTQELFAAMNTPDPANLNRSRGYVDVSR
jgi:hypothetical protein